MTRILVTVLAVAATLLNPAPAAASTSTSTLPAPTLKVATVRGDNVSLLWTPVRGAAGFGILANGRRIFGSASTDHALVFLASEGLTGRETFSVVAEDAGLNPSPPSNGLRPVAPAVLPAPVLTSATLSPNSPRLTLTWTPSRSDQDSIIFYTIFAFKDLHIMAVTNTTTASFDPDFCGGACPLNGTEPYLVVASDRTLAKSPPSNTLVPTPL